MRLLGAVVAASAATFLLAACAGRSQDFVPEDYPELYVSPDDGKTLLFTRPDLDLGRYRRIFLDATVVGSQDDGGERSSKDVDALEIAAYADRRFREALEAESFELVEERGEDVLRMQFRILDVKPTSKAQIAMMVPPFAMVNLVSPKGAFTGSIVLAGEFHEGLDEKPSVAFVAYGSRPGVDATVAFRPWDAAKKVIDNAAVRLARDLAVLRLD